MTGAATPSVRDLLHDADHRLVRAVDAVPDEEWGRPSLLPGWTRAHVVAHLVLNAEGLTRALEGAASSASVPMYDFEAERDAGITELAAAAPSELRDRLLGSTTLVSEALDLATGDQTGDDLAATVIERSPGRRALPVSGAAGFRLREVEIHLVDLDAGASYAAWTPAFTRLLIESTAAGRSSATVAIVDPDDLDGAWRFGGETTDAPVLRGDGASLAWWLTGRGAGQGVTSDTGALPEIGAW